MNRKMIYMIVLIIGTYVAAQLLADVSATKLVQIGKVVMPGGSLIFALTFTLRDVVHKRLGREWAHAAIAVAAGLNIGVAAYLYLVAQLGWPEFYAHGEAWGSIFALVPAITLGSIAAELVSQSVDTEIYHRWKLRFADAPQWTRVLVSNAVSIPVDSIVFTALAFVLLPPLFGAEAMPLANAIGRLASGQVLYKALVAIISIPLIYLVKDESII